MGVVMPQKQLNKLIGVRLKQLRETNKLTQETPTLSALQAITALYAKYHDGIKKGLQCSMSSTEALLNQIAGVGFEPTAFGL